MKGAIGRGAFASFIILFIFGAITLVIFQGAALMQEGELASEHFLEKIQIGYLNAILDKISKVIRKEE